MISYGNLTGRGDTQGIWKRKLLLGTTVTVGEKILIYFFFNFIYRIIIAGAKKSIQNLSGNFKIFKMPKT